MLVLTISGQDMVSTVKELCEKKWIHLVAESLPTNLQRENGEFQFRHSEVQEGVEEIIEKEMVGGCTGRTT